MNQRLGISILVILIASSTHIANAAQWSSAVRLSDKNNYAGFPVIDSNSNGDAYAAWVESEGKSRSSYVTVKVRKYDYTNDRWDYLGTLDRTHRMLDILNIAVDDNGNVFVIWKRSFRSDVSFFVSRYSTKKKMWEKLRISKGDALLDFNPQLILDKQGNAHIFWSGTNPSIGRVYVRSFSIDKEMWEKSIVLYGNKIEYFFTPSVDIDEKGNILTVSKDYKINLETFRVMTRFVTRVYDNNRGIWLPIRIIKAKESSEPPYVIGKRIGNAQIIWSESIKGDREYLRARTYSIADNSWGKKIRVSNPIKGEVDDVLLDMNIDGNAVVVWSQYYKKRITIYYNTYNAKNVKWDKQRAIRGRVGYEYCSDLDSDVDGKFIMICGNGKRNYIKKLMDGNVNWEKSKDLFVARRKYHVIYSSITTDKYENAYAVWMEIRNWNELLLGRAIYVSVYR